MKKRTIILCWNLFCFISLLLSQDKDFFDITGNTPEANMQINSITNPVDYSTGLANINIPLFEVKSRGKIIPISLSYNHNGLKAQQYSKWIGLGWNLNGEISITRSIKGKEDKLNDVYKDDLINYVEGSREWYSKCYYIATTRSNDSEPDIFYYKLLDRSGSFILHKEVSDGAVKAVTIPYDPIKIEIIDNGNGLKIIDDNGNAYTFNVKEGTVSSSNVDIPDLITSWKCSSIYDSQGNNLFGFEYKTCATEKNGIALLDRIIEDNPTNWHNARVDIPNISFNNKTYYAQWTQMYNNNGDPFYGEYNFSISRNTPVDPTDIHKPDLPTPQERLIDFQTLYPKRLSKIKVNDQVLLELITNNYGVLESISMLGKTISFDNQLFTEDNIYNNVDDKCPILNSLLISADNKTEKYNFDYYGTPPPKPDPMEMNYTNDFWGNNTTGTTGTTGQFYSVTINHKRDLIPQKELMCDADDKIYDSGFCSSGEDKTSTDGVLKLIINPLGGKTEFIYESNAYIKDKRPAQTLQLDIDSYPYDTKVQYSGGLRIKEIKYSDPNGAKLTRSFKYGQLRKEDDWWYVNESDPENGLGIITRQINISDLVDLQWNYVLNSQGYPWDNSITRLRKIYASPKGSTTFNSTPVVYNRVTEYIEKVNEAGEVVDNGKTVYNYNFPEFGWKHADGSISSAYNNYYVEKYDDWMYGQLTEKEVYKRNNDNTYTKIFSSSYEYENVAPDLSFQFCKVYQERFFSILGNNNPNLLDFVIGRLYPFNDPLDYFDLSLSDIYKYQSYIIKTGVKKPTIQIDKTFTDQGCIENKTEYQYGNKHIYPIEIKTTNSDSKIKIEKMKYTLDESSAFMSQNQAHLQAKANLADSWRLNTVLEKTEQTENTITNNYFSYKLFPVSQTSFPFVSQVSYDRNNTSINYITSTCNNYDCFGNPLYYISGDNINHVCLWSYSGQYPIAIMNNTTYTEVSNALTGTTPEQLSSSLVPDMAKVEALRRNPNLTKALITTYTYKPFVGISSITDPRGITTFYEYDDFNRLKQTYIIENGEKKVLQKTDYHYANQQ